MNHIQIFEKYNEQPKIIENLRKDDYIEILQEDPLKISYRHIDGSLFVFDVEKKSNVKYRATMVNVGQTLDPDLYYYTHLDFSYHRSEHYVSNKLKECVETYWSFEPNAENLEMKMKLKIKMLKDEELSGFRELGFM